MRISLNWVKRLLGRDRLPLSDAELQARLSLHVAEIEAGIERSGPRLDGVVAGRVLTCVQHPNADKLRCCTVDVGQAAPLPIVCGAPNVAAGQAVAVALVGTTLTASDGKSLTIKPAKLRGEPSQGMICAEDELGLGTGHDGILVLPGEPRPGTPLAEILGGGDSVLVVENHALTHRPDLWGQLGWAREIALVCGLPPPAAPDCAWSDLPGWQVAIEDPGCTVYCGAVVEGVHNRESPEWLRRLLEAAGVRPLGLLIDVTNAVMLELGEPMHAFDLRELPGRAVRVRAAAEGEAFTTLDGRSHRLAAGDLLIADRDRALALAGIMGGACSMVRDDTSAVLLEAAVFRPERIRRTRIRTGCATDSSARFEKGLPPEIAPAAIARAVALLAELCPGCRVTARAHAGTLANPERRIPHDPALAQRLTGLDIPAAEQARILAGLGFGAGDGAVTAPWWRAKDMHGGADLVEEVARHHGYDRIVPEVPRLVAAVPAPNLEREAEHRARRLLSGLGWDEVRTYAFTSTAWAEALGWDAGRTLTLAHPLSSEQTVLRRTLLPTLLEAAARNRKHLDRFAFYEIGRRYEVGCGEGERPDEEAVVAGMCVEAGAEAPFFAARDAALGLLAGLGFPASAKPADGAALGFQAGRCVELLVEGKVLGYSGEIARPLRAKAGIEDRVGDFVVFLERLVRLKGRARPVQHRALSRFQLVEREFTFDCPEELAYGELETIAGQSAGGLCQGVRLVTIYRGQPYAAGRKAVSLAVRLQSEEKTLEEADLAKASQRIATGIEKRTGAKLVGKVG